jgi:hypothetical protein
MPNVACTTSGASVMKRAPITTTTLRSRHTRDAAAAAAAERSGGGSGSLARAFWYVRTYVRTNLVSAPG